MLEDIKSNIEKLISLYETEKQRADALQAQLEQSRETIAAWTARLTVSVFSMLFPGRAIPCLPKNALPN